MNALRADQVGSLLRPSALLQARVDFFAERLDRAALRAEEDRAILDALRRQSDCGLDVYVDGEFRRVGFMTGFVEAVQGFVLAEDAPMPWRGAADEPTPWRSSSIVAGTRRIAGTEAAFLREHAPGPFKITLPSPLLFALTAYRSGVTDASYPTREALLADAARILADEARRLAGEGVPYVQLDCPGYAHWADPDLVARYRDLGVNLDRLLDAGIAGDNQILDAVRAAGAVAAVHLCRGSSTGRWLAGGAHDAIAERLFHELRCHRFLLELDPRRSGSFGPLHHVPASKVAVLGLIATRSGDLEARDELLRRIDEASRILPLEQLALSPQCGFASTQLGNPLITPEQQWRKLELVGSLAREVWP